MKEILLDGNNYMDEDGDIYAIDRPEWVETPPRAAWRPDRYEVQSLWDDADFEDDAPENEARESATKSRGTRGAKKPSLLKSGPHTEFIQAPEQGPSVSLVDRRLGLEAIMAYFNQANKRNGLSKSRGYNGFDARYGRRSSEVVANMTAKEERMYFELTRAARGLLQFEDSDMREMYREYGPGNAYAGDREKILRKARKTERMVIDGKKR
jgi:hypothetical protein